MTSETSDRQEMENKMFIIRTHIYISMYVRKNIYIHVHSHICNVYVHVFSQMKSLKRHNSIIANLSSSQSISTTRSSSTL